MKGGVTNVHVDIDRVGSWIQLDQLLLHLANTSDSALQSLLDEVSLLWVYDLIVALFEFPVDINVLDVQAGQMLENFLWWPRFNILNRGSERSGEQYIVRSCLTFELRQV